MSYGYIYKTTNLVNGKIYIGLHARPEFNPKYLGSGVLILRAVKKYGAHNFTVEQLLCALTVDALDTAEKAAIKEHREKYGRDMLYNLDDGGYRGGKKGGRGSPETGERVREANRMGVCGMLGRHHSEATKEKMRVSHTGKMHTTGAKDKMRAAKVGVPLGADHKQKISTSLKGINTWSAGRLVSRQTRERMSIARMGRPGPLKGGHRSEEFKKKVSAGMKGVNTWMVGRRPSAETVEIRRITNLNTFVRKLWAETILAGGE